MTTILHLTDGAPCDLRDATARGFATPAEYAAARKRELDSAMSDAGVAREALLGWNIEDQKLAYYLVPLSRRLAVLLAQRGPRFVLTHPYEGGHPDHDATALIVWAACQILGRNGRPVPTVVEMAFYHAGDAGPVYQRFLDTSEAVEIEVRLDQTQFAAKLRLLGRHETQQQTLAAFTSHMELFRIAPAYDFGAMPNGGRLLYEAWGLGVTGAEWLRLVRAALTELDLAA